MHVFVTGGTGHSGSYIIPARPMVPVPTRGRRISFRDIAEAIGSRLGLPTVSVPADAMMLPNLLADLDNGHYFSARLTA